jgi:hypothetical protein
MKSIENIGLADVKAVYDGPEGGYRRLLEDNGCEVLEAEDTGRFARYLDLYQEVSQAQLTYDALKIVGFDLGTMASTAQEFAFFGELAHAGKIAQGRFIARGR